MGEEEITFYGGPRDSETMAWRGGDTAEFPIYELGPTRTDFDARNEPVEFKTALYRRSLRNASVFVFQP